MDVPAGIVEATGPALTWRAPTRDDLPAWIELTRACQRADGDEPLSEEDLAAFYDSSGWDPADDARLVFAADGTLVADAISMVFAGARDFVRVHCWGGVRPEYRDRGIGSQLLDWQLRRGAERYRALETDLPGLYEVGGPLGSQARRRLFERYGFEPARYWSHMAHPLTDLTHRPAAQADGLRVTAYQEELCEQVRRAHNEAFADHWGSTVWDAPAWQERAVGNPTFRPELSFVVLDGTRRDPTVAAYVLAYENEPEHEGEPPVGYIGQVGTRRPWRGRGLASVLVCASIAAMKKAGYGKATLTVDAGNPTGAVSLYERLGFTVERRYVSYHRPVEPPT